MDEYADRSGAMGYCCELRCHNTPQAWQLGWLPVSQITGAELEPGSTITVQLLPQSSPEAKGVRIVPGWAQDKTPVFLGFRDRTGEAQGGWLAANEVPSPSLLAASWVHQGLVVQELLM